MQDTKTFLVLEPQQQIKSTSEKNKEDILRTWNRTKSALTSLWQAKLVNEEAKSWVSFGSISIQTSLSPHEPQTPVSSM